MDHHDHEALVAVEPASREGLGVARYVRSREDPEEAEQFNEEWHRLMPDTDIPMVIIESPYRSLIGPLLSYIDALDQQSPDDTVTVVLPELIPARPWEYLLHNQSALRLKAALLFRPNTVVANVPYVPTEDIALLPAEARDHEPLVALDGGFQRASFNQADIPYNSSFGQIGVGVGARI